MMNDIELLKPSKRGDKGGQVRLIQEWLCLHGHHISIDNDFGPATETAVKEFQVRKELGASGVVDNDTFARLVAPMRAALEPIPRESQSLGELVVDYGQRHLQQHPREIGGQNKGPWVRLYMDGNEGTQWAWCAGFVCYLLKQAANTLGVSLPITPSFSCDALAASAKGKGRFLSESSGVTSGEISPGSVFLVRKTSTDWTHTGIVTRAEAEVVRTIEGNTNDDGSREGYEVCARTRGYAGKDFIRI